jgi:hypothetical protein
MGSLLTLKKILASLLVFSGLERLGKFLLDVPGLVTFAKFVRDLTGLDPDLLFWISGAALLLLFVAASKLKANEWEAKDSTYSIHAAKVITIFVWVWGLFVVYLALAALAYSQL